MAHQKTTIADTEVFPIALGTMHFGTVIESSAAETLLDRYVELGGDFIDTANNYATWTPGGRGGESEQTIGRWMKRRGNRSKLFIATKVGFPVPADGAALGLTTAQIRSACENSLRRLGVETIDLYYAHHDDRTTPLEEILEAFHRLIADGKVRYVGASNYMTWRLAEAAAIAQSHCYSPFVCIQQRMSYLRPKSGADFDPQIAVNDELIEYCRAYPRFRLLAYSASLGGVYGDPSRAIPDAYRSAASETRLAELRAVARELGATPNQVMLAWLMQSEPNVIPVCGPSSREHLEENMRAVELELGEDALARLSGAGVMRSRHEEAKRTKDPTAK